MNKLIVQWAIVAVTLVLIFISEFIYSTPGFNWSLNHIPEIQAGASNLEISAWAYYSDVGMVVASAGPIIGPYLNTTTQRARNIYYIIFLGTTFLIMNVTKIWFHAPRPFWVEGEVQSYGSC